MSSRLEKELIIVGVALLIVAAIGFYWYSLQPAPAPAAAPATASPAAPAEETALGAEIYQKSSNPVGDRIPESSAPIANPLEGAYQNPFE